MKATNEQILTAYAETNSVWKTAQRFGMCGQSVHERLKKLGASKPVNSFSEAEKMLLVAEYQNYVSRGALDELAARMGRTKPFICRQARKLGLTNRARPAPWMNGPNLQMRDWHKNNDHPRGMLGKRHTVAARESMSKTRQEMWDNMPTDKRNAWLDAKIAGRKASSGVRDTSAGDAKKSWASGWRVVGPQRKYFRSRWEANYARYLQWLIERKAIKAWEHEPKTFWFEGIRRGVCSYKPDFRVTENNGNQVWHEVKGWMDDRSRVTLKRMAKYYPDEPLIVIDGKAYRAIAKKVSWIIPEWEHDAPAK